MLSLRGRLGGLGLAWMLAAQGAESPSAARESISAKNLARDVQILASDEFEGRGPGTRGEERTTRWLVDQFKAAGLRPGGLGGSWFQDVPMVGIRSAISATLHQGSVTDTLTSPQD